MTKKRELTEEEMRLLQVGGDVSPWQKWGPYLSERSWGTVREDYSSDGNAWNYLTYDMSRSKAYRWGEDGIAGICDRYQVLCFAFAFWNEKDPILKERFYGLGTFEGNHGEDVKEYYFYVDNTPTHSYMKYIYKYPQEEYPYQALHDENVKRSTKEREYELLDTGIFDQDRYFDIEIEYAKANKDDLCVRVTIHNRGDAPAPIHLLPHLWFRNRWSWQGHEVAKPLITKGKKGHDYLSLVADDTHAEPLPRLPFEYKLNKRVLYGDLGANLLFTENETNRERLYQEQNATPYVKDAFHRYIIDGEECINPEGRGTKACLHYKHVTIEGKGSQTFRFRLTNIELEDPLADVHRIIDKRKVEADNFYNTSVHQKGLTDDEKRVQRQAIAGMLWSKQIYLYDVNSWLKGDDLNHPPPQSRLTIRNHHWKHLISKRILSMPDKWEYPWFAAWDLAFHCITLALVDFDFAKDQIWYLLFDQFQHPNGQVPAYEWEFSEMNPPVQAWAVWRLYQMELDRKGKKDISFLKKCYHKLILNFVWWVNKVDSQGYNVFEGGFLGLDNITVIDRSAKIPGGGKIEQSDGTGWMGMFSLLLMRMSLELAKEDPDYEHMAVKFYEHFVYIGNALHQSENRQIQLWNEEDGFFYDVLSHSDGHNEQILVRSLVGLIPLYAIDSLTEEEIHTFQHFSESFFWFTKNRQDITKYCVTEIEKEGKKEYLFSLMNLEQMKRVLKRVWDPNEFRSHFGLRSLSKVYENNPYEMFGNSICYEPGEAIAELKGGNSNWRGPIWFPTSFLLIESLKRLHEILGDSFKIPYEADTEITPGQMAHYFANALIHLFEKQEDGMRPVFGDYEKFQKDPNWNNLILFYEHYHGDTGRGLGASHQTGWSGLVANLIDEWIRREE